MPVLPTDSKLRKEMPIFSGVLNYFPRTAAYVARISVLGNEKHNPGEPLHWAEGKSMDHPDCIVRHVIEANEFDPDDGALHAGKLAWRAWANCETILKDREAKGLPLWDEDVIAKNRAAYAAKVLEKRMRDNPVEANAFTRPEDATGRLPDPNVKHDASCKYPATGCTCRAWEGSPLG